ncbi:MAG TPA: VCBS repeat-containing protein [Planctomycetota bacterium]|nr:VCBS repeat-containing protein [Planctomycetota bacterium]
MRERCILGVAGLVTLLPAQQFQFSLQLAPNAYYGVQAVVGGDYDGDSRRDFVVLELGNQSTGAQLLQRVVLYSGLDGHQLLQFTHPSPSAFLLRCVAAIGDLDGDQIPDVVVGTDVGIDIRSGASLQWVQGLGSGGCSEAMSPGDLDGDGIPDLCVSPLSQAAYLALSGADGSVLWSAAGWWNGARVDDTDGDGVPDVALRDGTMVRLLSGANGQQLWSHPGGYVHRVVGLGDTNLDGVPDIAASYPLICQAGVCHGRVDILSGVDGQVLQSVTRPDPYSEFGSELAAAGDLDGSGRMGLLASNHGGFGPARLFGIAGSGLEVFNLDSPSIYGLIGGFDLDFDGREEFAFGTFGPSGSVFSIRVYSLIRAYYASFGAGCPGSQGLPTLTATAPPRMGQGFALQVANLAPFQLGFVFTGFSNQVWTATGLPLPISLGPIGLPSCSMLVSPDIDGVTYSAWGTASWGFTVPYGPSLYGYEFFNQALFFDPAAVGGMVVSNAGQGMIGN